MSDHLGKELRTIQFNFVGVKFWKSVLDSIWGGPFDWIQNRINKKPDDQKNDQKTEYKKTDDCKNHRTEYEIKINISAVFQSVTRQFYNLFQEPVEQPPLGFSIADEKIDSFKNQTG